MSAGTWSKRYSIAKFPNITWKTMTTTSLHKRIRCAVNIPNELVRIALAEFLGTFLLVSFTDAAAAQATLSRTLPESVFHIAWAVGSGLGLAIYITLGVSGGHVNPAITFGVASAGLIPWRKVPVYVAAQFTGALVAAFSVYGVYQAALDNFDGGVRMVVGVNGSAGIFATFPQPYLPLVTGFFEQIFNTGLMLIACFAILDPKNCKVSSGLAPFLLGHVVFVIIISFGFNAGSPLNPARDFAGRVVCSAVGYDYTVWTGGMEGSTQWWWIAVIGPLIGAVLGTWCYLIFVDYQHPLEEDELRIADIEFEDKTPDELHIEDKNDYDNNMHEPTSMDVPSKPTVRFEGKPTRV